MKKNLIIIVLSIVSVASLTFGYTQKQKADKEMRRAKIASMEALEQRKQAEISAQLAIVQRTVAEEFQKTAIEKANNMRKEAELAQKNQ